MKSAAAVRPRRFVDVFATICKSFRFATMRVYSTFRSCISDFRTNVGEKNVFWLIVLIASGRLVRLVSMTSGQLIAACAPTDRYVCVSSYTHSLAYIAVVSSLALKPDIFVR